MDVEKVAALLILLAIPYFYGLIGLEILYAKWKGRKVYRLNDSITDINMGILDRTLDIFAKVAVIGAYILCYESFHFLEIGLNSPVAWIVAFVLVDFCFYWSHRMCHTINFLWACHVVHHSSEEMNLTVALRQSATESLFTWTFYLPLAFIGFPWPMWVICYQINLLYQFWVHTQMVGKLGPVEWIMNTPSHHRVHHGADEKYIDKNHAGVFIIWDRMFGTFQEEEEDPTYGIVTPLRSWNPVWGHLHYWVRLFNLSRSAKRLKEKVLVWVKSPPWLPEGVEPTPPERTVRYPAYQKFDIPIGKGLTAYTFLQFLSLMGLVSALMFTEQTLPFGEKLFAAAMILWALLSVGGLLERKRWALISEFFRVPAMILFLSAGTIRMGLVSSATIPMGVAFFLTVGLLFFGWAISLRREFSEPLLDPSSIEVTEAENLAK
ncbi:MAG: sterol desaturase family protein [Candidatus Omnitrophica bacterium]|nr:sterol desaturase family protein [Candidatus Omnitrophota bacterium]